MNINIRNSNNQLMVIYLRKVRVEQHEDRPSVSERVPS